MSAIWGIVSNNDKEDTSIAEQKMRQTYKDCVIDRTEYVSEDTVSFGCGIQYFTLEAQYEKLPIKENDVYFTADVIIDNREELIQRLGIYEQKDKENLPDGRLLYEMFKKYKENCLNDILGAYSFVYYDKGINELYLVADSTGTRSLYYIIQDGKIYFSTLIESIISATGAKKLNEQWITDFLALDNMAWAIEYDKTPYEGIYKIPASHYVKIKDGKSEVIRYWSPNIKELKGKTEEEYKELFKSVFEASVKRMMRNENMTILLSGGLDSTSVACFAAKEAAQTGKTLTSFTSVPEKDFKSNLSDYYVTDESEAVLKTQKFLKDKGYKLNCRFMDLAGRNSWDDRKEEIKSIELPYKSMQNLLWMKEGMKCSYEMGARILMTGGYGNVTISNSFPSVYQYELVRGFHWIKFIQDCMINYKTYNIGKKKAVKIIVGIIKDAFFRPKPELLNDVTGKSYIKKEFMEKHNFAERFLEDNKKYTEALYSGKAAKELMINDKIFYQLGETQTKHSLATGVIVRDPTMDKKLIEFCMSLPISCFSQKVEKRRLVRVYLSDDLPHHVTKPTHYGLQSADTLVRLKKDEDRIFGEISNILNSSVSKKYIDTKKAQKSLQEMKDFDAPNRNFEVLRLEYTALTMEYIDKGIKEGRFMI